MLDALQHYAIKLKILKPIALILTIVSITFIIYTVIQSSQSGNDEYFIPAIILLLWSLSLNMMLATFPHVPDKANHSQHSFFQRIKLNLQRSFYYLLGIIFLSSTILALYLSYKLLNIWLKQ